MVRDAPQAALLTMRGQGFRREKTLILRSPPTGGRLEGWAASKPSYPAVHAFAPDLIGQVGFATIPPPAQQQAIKVRGRRMNKATAIDLVERARPQQGVA